MQTPTYLWLPPGGEPPDLTLPAFKAVVVVEADVTPDWRAAVSTWLVDAGCLYMMAWGRECSEWDTSVDLAFLRKLDFGNVPDDRFVMTTWHDGEQLSEVFWFSWGWGHDDPVMPVTLILDINDRPRETEMLAAFAAATDPGTDTSPQPPRTR